MPATRVKFKNNKIHAMKISLFLAVIMFASCTISLVPSANIPVYQQVTTAAQKTDDFYKGMEEANDKNYATYAAKYQEIQGDIIAIQRADSLRAKSGILLSQVQQLKTYFTYCMNNHFAKRVLNNSQLEVYRTQLAGYWKPIIINEKHYK